VQLAPFLVLMAGLHFILFKPMLAFLEQRQAATVGARAEAEKLQSRAGEQVGKYESAVNAARGEVADLRAARRAAANVEYQRIVAAARTESEEKVSGAVVRIRAEASAARAQLEGASRALADDVAAQVLGRPLSQTEA
jgi:F-type H+-transporting ATPase subunit b